ncbi:hypothetical protein JS44_08560 [Anoxybacillus flavithermus]|uniref:Uncharacterized protein n=1 Tax=Anoxybacillus flavithermus TaxID=33934 RepID=A0A094LC05_9BACL|nr:hypothetical protein JS44_08560 [Anoxybacillus flavithermus]
MFKISNRSIVILDEEDYEKKAAFATIKRFGDEKIFVKSWAAKTTLSGTYKACRVQYHDSKRKNDKSNFYAAEVPKVGRTLVVTEEVNLLLRHCV